VDEVVPGVHVEDAQHRVARHVVPHGEAPVVEEADEAGEDEHGAEAEGV